MSKYKLNISFDCFTLQKIAVTMIIRKCVEETLKTEINQDRKEHGKKELKEKKEKEETVPGA